MNTTGQKQKLFTVVIDERSGLTVEVEGSTPERVLGEALEKLTGVKTIVVED